MITRKRLFAVGAAFAAVGIALFAIGMGYQTPKVGASGDPTPDPCATLRESSQPLGDVHFVSFGGQQQCTPTATVRVATKTPTSTNTPEATATRPPATATQPPAATATSPSGGAGAGGVRPPNTGTGGSDRGSDLWLWLAAGGAALAVLGGAGIAAGALRRR